MQDTSYRYGSSKEGDRDRDRELVDVELTLDHDLEAMEERLLKAKVDL